MFNENKNKGLEGRRVGEDFELFVLNKLSNSKNYRAYSFPMLDYGSRKTDVVVIHIDNPDQPLYLQLSNNEKSKKQKESLANKGILSLSSFIIKQYDGDIEKILNEHFSEKDNHPESEAKTLEQKQFDTDKKYYLGKAS